mgnify:CR=1 FL=1
MDQKRVGMISLGCPKNLVDSEIMIGHLHQAGMVVIPEAGHLSNLEAPGAFNGALIEFLGSL